MERRDYLMQQIQMMGLFLQKLIARMRKREEDSNDGDILDMVKSEMRNELDIDIEVLVFLRDKDFFTILKEKHFTETHLENLAEILFILGKPKDFAVSVSQRNYLQKSLAIYTEIEKESRNFSIERNDRIMEIHQLLI